MYPLASAEIQLRRLGDLALLLGDVRFALSIYDTVRKDYQHDKAMRHLAGINEVLGLCNGLVSDGGPREAEPFIDAAVSGYASRLRMSAWAVRTVLIAAEAYAARGAFRDIPGLLQRMVAEVRSLESFRRHPRPSLTVQMRHACATHSAGVGPALSGPPRAGGVRFPAELAADDPQVRLPAHPGWTPLQQSRPGACATLLHSPRRGTQTSSVPRRRPAGWVLTQDRRPNAIAAARQCAPLLHRRRPRL